MKKRKDEKWLWEAITLGKEEATRRQRVRSRTSYKRWVKKLKEVKRILSFSRKEIAAKKLLQMMYDSVEELKGFGSATHSCWSEESLILLFDDVDL